MKYVVVLEPTATGFSAYVPDLPGCVAAADTIDETEALIREAISGHVELLKERGEPIPEPASRAAVVDIA